MAETAPPVGDAEDQVTLIPGQVQPPRSSYAIFIYVICKLLPWAVYFWPQSHSGQSTALFSLLLLIDLVICRGSLGYNVVGLSWGIDCANGITYRFEPDPFVPSTIDSNVFWVTLFGQWIVLIVLGVVNIMQRDFSVFCAFAALAIADFLNIKFYLNCLLLAKKQSEDAFRNVMVYAPQQFPTAEDVSLDMYGKRPEPAAPPPE
jgi:hypothetical protein